MNKKYLDELIGAFLSIKNKKEMRTFLQGILTLKELEEIPTRLQIVKALKSGLPHQEIARHLKVGIATVTRGSREIKLGRFKNIK